MTGRGKNSKVWGRTYMLMVMVRQAGARETGAKPEGLDDGEALGDGCIRVYVKVRFDTPASVMALRQTDVWLQISGWARYGRGCTIARLRRKCDGFAPRHVLCS